MNKQSGATFYPQIVAHAVIGSKAGQHSIGKIAYPSADTDRDFRISVSESLRVIELYNVRSGTVRTGQYRVQIGSEDGFATAPQSLSPSRSTSARWTLLTILKRPDSGGLRFAANPSSPQLATGNRVRHLNIRSFAP